MERLKSVLADKIMEVSSVSGDYSKLNLEKLNRFRDFAFACEALMKKYPRIEDELVGMIQSNDFDTRVASSRVNNIIAMMENGGGFEQQAGANHEIADSSAEFSPNPDQPNAEANQHALIEDTVLSDVDDRDGLVGETTSNYGASENLEFDYSSENKIKTNLNRVLIVLAVVAGVVLAYFAIKFVIHNWRIILIVIGIIAATGGLLWFLSNKKNNNEIE